MPCWHQVLSVLAAFAVAVAGERKPIHVPTDGAKWFGNDGMWSTATYQVGNPGQAVYLLAGTSSSITTVVNSVSCNDPASGYTCDERGRAFSTNESTTWKDIGAWQLGIRPELIESNLKKLLGSEQGAGDFGRDTIKIDSGLQNVSPVKRDGQVIAAVNDTSLLIGMMGLGVKSRSFKNDEMYPSFLSTLFDNGTIPSKSYGYQAGNYYDIQRTPMDLVLGGTNYGRYSPNNVTFPLDANQNPVLSLNNIVVTATGIPPWGAGPDRLSLEPAQVQIDSTTPFLWLPPSICRQFEQDLGLKWNDSASLYLFDSSNARAHENLKQLNMTFTFTLAFKPGSPETVDIVVPYSSLDLSISWPYVGTTHEIPYFPLKRAANEDQYTLGRAFLQHAYLAVDYGHQNFSIHQATFPAQNDNIVPIPPPGQEAQGDMGAGSSTAGSHKPAIGAIVGGVVGGVAFIVLALLLFRYLRPKKGEHAGGEQKPDETAQPEQIEGQQIWEAYGDFGPIKPPFAVGHRHSVASEMHGEGMSRSELPAVNIDPAELPVMPIARAATPQFSFEISRPASRADSGRVSSSSDVLLSVPSPQSAAPESPQSPQSPQSVASGRPQSKAIESPISPLTPHVQTQHDTPEE